MNTLIELNNITKTFDDQQVLKGINLIINENEFLTLLGPSGCGKTTTLRIIAGFDEADSGELLFDGIEISKLQSFGKAIGDNFLKKCELFQKNGLMNIENDRYYLTDSGMLLSNSIITECLE